MTCKKCGASIDENNQKFCNQCGEKIINNNQIDAKKNNEVEQKSQPYLIIGIILALCCSLPFGVAIILLNELKYKPQLKEDNLKEAEKTKKIMIVLMIIGLIFGIFISGLSFLLEFITAIA